MYGVMNIVPWGGPTMRAASVIGIEVSDLYQFIMPSVAALAVIAFGIAFVIARIEIHNGAGADKDDTAADEKGAGEGTAKRKKLYWFNLGLTVLMLALLFVDIGLPLHLIFMIAFCIALTVNYPCLLYTSPAVMVDQIVNPSGPFYDQPFSHLEGHKADVLAYNKNVQQITLCSRFFDQIQVAQGKWIGVHDNG